MTPATFTPTELRAVDRSIASECLKAALDYAESYGWRCFPCRATAPTGDKPKGGKLPIGHNRFRHPAGGSWKRHATADADQLRALWAEAAGDLLAVATGEASGVLVVDLDTEAAVQSFDRLAAEWKDPPTVRARTSSGAHLFYSYPKGSGIGNSADGLRQLFARTGGIGADAIDVRGEGGLLILPPSLHPTGVRYLWERSPAEFQLADPPEWLLSALTAGPASDDAADRPKPGAGLPSNVAELLQAIPADDYSDWIRVGAALHYCDPVAGLELWDQWSRTSTKYAGRHDIEKRWASFVHERPSGASENGRPHATENTLRKLARKHGGTLTLGPQSWPEEIRLPSVPAPEPVPLEGAPAVVSDFVATLAAHFQTAPEMSLGMVLTTISATQLGRAVIEVEPDWWECPQLYTVTVAESGSGKSPQERVVTRVLRALEQQAVDHAAAARSSAMRVHETEVNRLQQLQRSKSGKGQSPPTHEEIEAQDRRCREALQAIPPRADLIVQEGTPEGFVKLLSENCERAVFLDSEGDAFENFQGRYNEGGLQAEILKKAFSCESMHSERVGREPIRLLRPSVAVGLMTQPGVLAGQKHEDGMRRQGIFARFLILRPKNTVGTRSFSRPPLDRAAVSRFDRAIERLLRGHWPAQRYTVPPFGAFEDFKDRGSKGTLKIVRLDSDCWGVREHWHEVFEEKVRDGGEWQGIRDWVGKAKGHAVRVAYALHAVEMADQDRDPWDAKVPGRLLNAGFSIVESLASHFIHEMGLGGLSTKDGRILHLLNHLTDLASEKPEPSVHDLHQKVRGDKAFRAKDDFDPWLDELKSRGYIRTRKVSTGGRSTEKLEIHPDLDPQSSKSLKGSTLEGAFLAGV